METILQVLPSSHANGASSLPGFHFGTKILLTERLGREIEEP